jgi:hypothetical protein
VHAKGAGAFGYFEVTSPEIQKYCRYACSETPLEIEFDVWLHEMHLLRFVPGPLSSVRLESALLLLFASAQ